MLLEWNDLVKHDFVGAAHYHLFHLLHRMTAPLPIPSYRIDVTKRSSGEIVGAETFFGSHWTQYLEVYRQKKTLLHTEDVENNNPNHPAQPPASATWQRFRSGIEAIRKCPLGVRTYNNNKDPELIQCSGGTFCFVKGWQRYEGIWLLNYKKMSSNKQTSQPTPLGSAKELEAQVLLARTENK